MITTLSWRFKALAFLFFLIAVVIIGRLIHLQIGDFGGIPDEGKNYRGEWRLLTPARGEIYDRSGNLLAGNKEVYEIGVDLVVLKEMQALDRETPEGIAMIAQQYLGLDYQHSLTQILTALEDQRYVLLGNYVDPVAVKNVDDLEKALAEDEEDGGFENPTVVKSLYSLVRTPQLQRSYPESTLGFNILGFVARDGQGYFGVEERYNNLLAGEPEWVWLPWDPYLAAQRPDLDPGVSVILTLDREIQAAMEALLDRSLEDNGAVGGTILVMNPQTGEILAMATSPRLDLNQYWEYPELIGGSIPYNRTIGDDYEPGSVFKLLTMASAMDAGRVQPGTEFLDTGYVEVGGQGIRNWDGGAWGPQTMLSCMQHSLNVCLVWVAQQLGPVDFYAYLDDFGMGTTTDVDLAGEISGVYRTPGITGWHESDLATNAFGQGISTTPLQLAVAISALANDGKIMTPYILSGMIIDGTQKNLSPQLSRSPISAETAQTMSVMMAESLEEEASSALVPGYTVAGKTGTAQIPTPYGYDPNDTNASFVGWGPIDDPQFLVYIWFEKPQSSTWASQVASPVFSEAVERLVVLMDIPPDQIRLGLAGQ